jgi:hypothetical protein
MDLRPPPCAHEFHDAPQFLDLARLPIECLLCDQALFEGSQKQLAGQQPLAIKLGLTLE